jgi:hypothetical protein
MELKDLTQAIHNTRSLRQRWSARKIPPGKPVIPPDEIKQFEKEEKALSDSTLTRELVALKADKELIHLALTFAAFQTDHYGRMLQLFGGGMTRSNPPNLLVQNSSLAGSRFTD